MPTKTTSKPARKKAPAGRKTVRKVALPPLDAANVQDIPLSLIVCDPSLQTRVSSDGDQIDNLKAALEAGDPVPPIVLFEDTGHEEIADIVYLPGDGWHRYYAHQELGRKTIRAEIRAGGRAEALKYALGANASHGLRRTNADKRKAVTVALKEYPKLSDRQIAEICKVTHPYVANVRKEVVTVTTSRTGKDGKEYPVKGGGQETGQLDFFKLLSRDFDPCVKELKTLAHLPVLADETFPAQQRLEGIRAMREQIRRTETELKDLEEAIASTVKAAS